MGKKIIIGVSLFSLLGFMSLAMPALALDSLTDPITSIKGIITLINTIATWFFNIVLAVAVIVLLLAAFQWLTSGGNEEKVGTARKNLIWGLVGIAVAFLAKGLVALIKSLVGA